jgi:hypothetical protein
MRYNNRKGEKKKKESESTLCSTKYFSKQQQATG